MAATPTVAKAAPDRSYEGPLTTAPQATPNDGWNAAISTAAVRHAQHARERGRTKGARLAERGQGQAGVDCTAARSLSSSLPAGEAAPPPLSAHGQWCSVRRFLHAPMAAAAGLIDRWPLRPKVAAAVSAAAYATEHNPSACPTRSCTSRPQPSFTAAFSVCSGRRLGAERRRAGRIGRRCSDAGTGACTACGGRPLSRRLRTHGAG